MTNSTPPSRFFISGGTLRRNAPSYVVRPADEELLNLALAGEYCNVLTARQMGKSSLMVRTAERLRAKGISTAIVDLTNIGTNISANEWYFGMVAEIARQLFLKENTEINIDEWWANCGERGVVQRFSDFLRDVVLAKINGPVVIFVDEIDITLQLDFADDFFSALRATYNNRANDPLFNRITFILLGVTRPADLVKDRTRTPYNIGTNLDLTDFQYNELSSFVDVLNSTYPDQGEEILKWVLSWTGGQPYLTQKLCAEVVVQPNQHINKNDINELVLRLFLKEESRKELHLRAISDRIQKSPQATQMIRIYSDLLKNKIIADEERSIEKIELKLTGLVRVSSTGNLEIRNRIYRSVFNNTWVKANTPASNTNRWTLATSIIAFVLLVFAGYVIYRQQSQTVDIQAQTFIQTFQNSTSPEVRLTSLAGLFELGGDYTLQGREMFFNLSEEEQLAMFNNLTTPQDIAPELVIVIENLYQWIDKSGNGNDLLRAMNGVLGLIGAEGAPALATEIEFWLQGRYRMAAQEYTAALNYFSDAIDKSASRGERNYAVLFDRAQIFEALGEHEKALSDFEAILDLEQSWQAKIVPVFFAHPQLVAAWERDLEAYPLLTNFLPTVTPIPPITTSTQSLLAKSATPTLEITPTKHVTVTPTPSSDIQFSLPTEAISENNISSLSQLARWGKGVLNELAWAPDSNLIGVASMLGIYLYDSQTLELKLFIPTDTANMSLAFSPDEKILATGTQNGAILLWNTNGTISDELPIIHTKDVTSLVFSPDGKILASGSKDGSVSLWSIEEKSILHVLEGHLGKVVLAFSPDGHSLATGSEDNLVRIWDVTTGTQLTIFQGHEGPIQDLAFSPDGTLLASSSFDKTIRLWDFLNGKLEMTLKGHSGRVTRIDFSSDGQTLVSSSWDLTIRSWNIQTGSTKQILEGHFALISNVLFSSKQGDYIVSGSEDGTIRLWNLANGQLVKTNNDFVGIIRCIAISQDGHYLALGTRSGNVQIWDAIQGNLLHQLDAHVNQVTSVIFSPDQEVLYTGSDDTTIKAWRVSDGELLQSFLNSPSNIESISVSPDGSLLVAGAFDGSIRLWKTSGELIQTFYEHTSSVWSVDFSSDGKLFASGSLDGTIRIWRLSDRKMIKIYGAGDKVWSVAFSPTSSLVAAGYGKGEVLLWDYDQNKSLNVLQGHHTDEIWSLAFSPDGHLLATGSFDRTIGLWNVVDGELLGYLTNHVAAITQVYFSPSGNYIVSSSYDGTVRIWGIP